MNKGPPRIFRGGPSLLFVAESISDVGGCSLDQLTSGLLDAGCPVR